MPPSGRNCSCHMTSEIVTPVGEGGGEVRVGETGRQLGGREGEPLSVLLSPPTLLPLPYPFRSPRASQSIGVGLGLLRVAGVLAREWKMNNSVSVDLKRGKKSRD